jgi:hypothetical protein
MVTAKGAVRPIASGLAAGTLLRAAAAPAAAWPMPPTLARTIFWNAVCRKFTGELDQPPLTGPQACRQLYTGQPTSAVSGATAAQYRGGR